MKKLEILSLILAIQGPGSRPSSPYTTEAPSQASFELVRTNLVLVYVKWSSTALSMLAGPSQPDEMYNA